MEAKWTTQKYSLLNMYLAKLNEVLNFMKKTRQIYDLNIYLQKTQKHKQEVKKEFGNSSHL